MNTEARIASLSRWHVLFGLAFAVLGMGLGIYMAKSENHTRQSDPQTAANAEMLIPRRP